jgi:hydroxypyruvate isomerase
MEFTKMSRRSILAGLAATGAAGLLSQPVAAEDKAIVRKGRIHQSACRWCYQKTSLDDLCAYGAKIGLAGIDLLDPSEYDFPRKYGLRCTMAYGGGGTIAEALNRVEHHDAIEAAFRTNIPLAAKAGVPNIITFSGNRKGMSDEEGAKNCVIGLNRLKKIAEDNGVTICVELLNSKIDHHDYMCDHTAWGVNVVKEVNSPNVKLLYDIYHMQIMEGDLIRTIRENIQWLGHFHTGGVPGRHELDDTQEVQWATVMRAIADAGYKGYVAQEFVPSRDPLTSLREAVDICDV